MSDAEKRYFDNVKWFARQLVDLIPGMTVESAMKVAQKLVYRYARREAEKGEK